MYSHLKQSHHIKFAILNLLNCFLKLFYNLPNAIFYLKIYERHIILKYFFKDVYYKMITIM